MTQDSTPPVEPDPDTSREQALREGQLAIEGRLVSASNATLRARVSWRGMEARCVVKPVAGERPLWDFPEGTLSGREIAAHAVSATLGWDLVPPTVWREETEFGPAMLQWWIDEDHDARPVDVVRPGHIPDGWVGILEARDAEDQPVILTHAVRPDLERMALFDAVVNNADRKGGHVLSDASGRLWGIDHGVTFAEEDKLRTVLWGWAGDEISAALLDDLRLLDTTLDSGVDDVERFLSPAEQEALRDRVHRLLDEGRLPLPSPHWPAVPWPVF